LNSSQAIVEESHPAFRFTHRQSLILVFICTLFGVGAQYMLKIGASTLHSASALDMLRNPWVVGGYGLYGFSTCFLILALRDGELSLLYPVISLTYVWVTIMSIFVFHESVSAFKLIGIAVICSGVALLGSKGNE
jgi:multidrug transporter EmrE-like cation transporter